MTIAPHMLRPVAKMIAIDEPMHWHVVMGEKEAPKGTNPDGSEIRRKPARWHTIEIQSSWEAAKESERMLKEEEVSRQWNSPIRISGRIFRVQICWSERCIKIMEL